MGGDDEVDFICACPGTGCPSRGEPFVWAHVSCLEEEKHHGLEKIDSEANVKCLSFGLKAPIFDWRFNCGSHYGIQSEDEYLRAKGLKVEVEEKSKYNEDINDKYNKVNELAKRVKIPIKNIGKKIKLHIDLIKGGLPGIDIKSVC